MEKRAILVEISADVFERVQRSGEVKQEEFGANTFLDSAWFNINKVLKNAKPPLTFAISGDFHPSYSPEDLESFINQNKNPYYISFTSPAKVTSIAEGFSGLSEVELNYLSDKANIEIDDIFRNYFGKLRNAYIYASLNGNAISIIIA